MHALAIHGSEIVRLAKPVLQDPLASLKNYSGTDAHISALALGIGLPYFQLPHCHCNTVQRDGSTIFPFHCSMIILQNKGLHE